MNILTQTADGSNTLFNEEIGEHYHSSHGAFQESKHVFVEAGLKYAIETHENQPINVLEVGFGTGLNFLLSFSVCDEQKINLNYTGLEAFPLKKSLLESTGYQKYVSPEIWESFIAKYENSLLEPQQLSPKCTLTISNGKLQNYRSQYLFDIIYYDAFSVRHQPEMWTDEIISQTCNMLRPGGIFVTYAITGNLKRAVKAAGLTVEKLPGAPEKREMLRATKI